MIKPQLEPYSKPESLSQLPGAVCAKAGCLWQKNSGWRNVRPVIDKEACVGCLQCYMYCPDGVIFKKDGKVDIDYDFCKGCGICAKQCPVQAVSMEEEKKHG